MTNNYYFPRGGLEDSVRNAGFPVLIVNIDNRHASEPLREKEPMNVTIQQKKNPAIGIMKKIGIKSEYLKTASFEPLSPHTDIISNTE